jgi:hypothetical protein
MTERVGIRSRVHRGAHVPIERGPSPLVDSPRGRNLPPRTLLFESHPLCCSWGDRFRIDRLGKLSRYGCWYGGEGGIRTHGRVTPTAVFETARFGRSRTSPQAERPRIITHLPAVPQAERLRQKQDCCESVVKFSRDRFERDGLMTRSEVSVVWTRERSAQLLYSWIVRRSAPHITSREAKVWWREWSESLFGESDILTGLRKGLVERAIRSGHRFD